MKKNGRCCARASRPRVSQAAQAAQGVLHCPTTIDRVLVEARQHLVLLHDGRHHAAVQQLVDEVGDVIRLPRVLQGATGDRNNAVRRVSDIHLLRVS